MRKKERMQRGMEMSNEESAGMREREKLDDVIMYRISNSEAYFCNFPVYLEYP